ncbi:putative chitin-binding protein [Streptomyces sp. NBRC 110611]|uniref:lytic polysaccharide monooxygenase auxiliary activity family 9 protein n=1 Tax=Streptomyces sp. NBRC 110611 TaxID=1621259 RepID=UPI000831E5B0|nr:lytic polysaccharide monooxygenase auxiliary activity family 9 protein [Streptomyces sp. NBRC 110611]GAU65785.1 putative chitin-binding protein [Streptomyces sp. NBRC 110611]
MATQENIRSDEGAAPAHGWVTQPPSRAALLFNDGYPSQALEAGKFFPATQGGLADPLQPSDVPSDTPPPDGKIASAGYAHGGAPELDEVRDWKKVDLVSGAELKVVWNFEKRHKTRRYHYFVTKNDWDPSQPLSRSQFEAEPFAKLEPNGDRPYWELPDPPPQEPVEHTITLPQRAGYHVVLGVGEVADTGAAFYQVIDANFA